MRKAKKVYAKDYPYPPPTLVLPNPFLSYFYSPLPISLLFLFALTYFPTYLIHPNPFPAYFIHPHNT